MIHRLIEDRTIENGAPIECERHDDLILDLAGDLDEGVFLLLGSRHHPDLSDGGQDLQFDGFPPAILDGLRGAMGEIHGSHQRSHTGSDNRMNADGVRIKHPHHADVNESTGSTAAEGKHRRPETHQQATDRFFRPQSGAFFGDSISTS